MSSKYLIRTNPRLTSNIKIVTNNELVWLESFDTNPILSSIRYKHFSVPRTERLQFQFSKFWKNTDKNSMFDIPSNLDASIFRTDFSQQYLPIYWAGSQYIEDKYYKERFEYLAPLYIDPQNIPKAFIIFRADGASNIESSKDYWIKNIASRWKTVKYFNMDQTSPIGELLYRMYQDNNLPYSSLNIDYSKATLSIVSGIDIKNGGFVNKFFPFFDEASIERTTFDLEEYVSLQYSNNDLCHPFMMNLKWIFDDVPSGPLAKKPWSINSYYGFYINSLEKITSWDMSIGINSFYGSSAGGFVLDGDISLINTRPEDTLLLLFDNNYYTCVFEGNELFINSDSEINSSSTTYTIKLQNHTTSISWSSSNKIVTLYRIDFCPVHDLDMERMDTDFANFEYNNQNKLSTTLEPKQYISLGVTKDIDPSRTQPDFTTDISYKGEDFRTSSRPIPVTSEYIAELDTFCQVNNHLKNIWSRTPWSSKFGFLGSNNIGNWEYRLSNNIISGKFNRSTNNINNVLLRPERTLDWFYTISGRGIWDFSTLHLDNSELVYFDIYELAKITNPSAIYNDYLQYVFGKQTITSKGNLNVNRWAYFTKGTKDEIPSAIYKGIKFSIGQVTRTNKSSGVVLDDRLNGYRISSLLTQRPKWILDADNNTIIDPNLPNNLRTNTSANFEVGIDIIKDDRSKSIVIWIWILMENRNIDNVYFPLSKIPLDDTERDIMYNIDSYQFLLYNGLKRPSLNNKDIDYFSPFVLTSSIFSSTLNNIGLVSSYKGGIRHLNITDNSIVYENPLNSGWRLFVENSQNITISSGERRYSDIDIPSKEILYSSKNILSKGNSYIGNVPSPDVYYKQPGGVKLTIKNNISTSMIYRHKGHYDIITKEINLWTREETLGVYSLKKWDFDLKDWGLSSEWIWSKTSRGGIDTKDFSESLVPLFPMVDEFGYDWGKRNILNGTWSKDFYFEYEPIDLGINDKDIRQI